MNKAHSPINWVNEPNTETPINANNLNKMDNTIGTLDDRIVVLDTSKASTTELGDCFNSVAYDSKTGRFIFYKKNGSIMPVNTGLSQIVLNLEFDDETQEFILYHPDGSTKRINVSAFIANNEFLESETIAWELQENGKVSAIIKDGSIKGSKLSPNYFALVKSYSEQAELSAEEANTSADEAKASAVRAEEAADKAVEIVGGDFATNTKVDNIINGTTPVAKATDADTVGGKHASDFLSSKGGTVNGKTTISTAQSIPFGTKNTNGDTNMTSYEGASGVLGYLGFDGLNNPAFLKPGVAYYPLHHDGNSAKVIQATSAPSDTTAVWVDTANKVTKIYIGGAWTALT